MGLFKSNEKTLENLQAEVAAAKATIEKYTEKNKALEEIDKLKAESTKLKKSVRRAKFRGMAKFADKATKITAKTAKALVKGGAEFSKYASETKIGKGKMDILGNIGAGLPKLDNKPSNVSVNIFSGNDDTFNPFPKKKTRR